VKNCLRAAPAKKLCAVAEKKRLCEKIQTLSAGNCPTAVTASNGKTICSWQSQMSDQHKNVQPFATK